MPLIYERAEDFVHMLAGEIIKAHHPDLIAPGFEVRLCILFAHDAEHDHEPALLCHGYQAAAVISVIPYKQRVDKRADAEIIVDHAHFSMMTMKRQNAVLDHELEHLEVKRKPTIDE